jgi:hypothetical protein
MISLRFGMRTTWLVFIAKNTCLMIIVYTLPYIVGACQTFPVGGSEIQVATAGAIRSLTAMMKSFAFGAGPIQ